MKIDKDKLRTGSTDGHNTSGNLHDLIFNKYTLIKRLRVELLSELIDTVSALELVRIRVLALCAQMIDKGLAVVSVLSRVKVFIVLFVSGNRLVLLFLFLLLFLFFLLFLLGFLLSEGLSLLELILRHHLASWLIQIELLFLTCSSFGVRLLILISRFHLIYFLLAYLLNIIFGKVPSKYY